MSRADGPFKILRKINDNAYKLELPPKFGVRTTLPSNSCIGRVRPPIWVIYICMERYGDDISSAASPMVM
jgi:hypothetical protein